MHHGNVDTSAAGQAERGHPTFLPSQLTALWKLDAKKQPAEEAGGGSPIDKSEVGEAAVECKRCFIKRQKQMLPLGFEPRRLASAALETAAFCASFGLNLSAIAAWCQPRSQIIYILHIYLGV